MLKTEKTPSPDDHVLKTTNNKYNTCSHSPHIFSFLCLYFSWRFLYVVTLLREPIHNVASGEPRDVWVPLVSASRATHQAPQAHLTYMSLWMRQAPLAHVTASLCCLFDSRISKPYSISSWSRPVKRFDEQMFILARLISSFFFFLPGNDTTLGVTFSLGNVNSNFVNLGPVKMSLLEEQRLPAFCIECDLLRQNKLCQETPQSPPPHCWRIAPVLWRLLPDPVSRTGPDNECEIVPQSCLVF